PVFKKPLKTGENIHTMANTPLGLLYITDTDANIVNLGKGDAVWAKPIQYKKAKAVSSAYDQANNRYLISTGEEVLAINENNGDVGTWAEGEPEGEESDSGIDVRGAGILLTSDQIIFFKQKTAYEIYHTYHKAPGQSGVMKAAMGVMTVASAAVAAAAATQSTYHYSLGNYSSAGAQRANRN